MFRPLRRASSDALVISARQSVIFQVWAIANLAVDAVNLVRKAAYRVIMLVGRPRCIHASTPSWARIRIRPVAAAYGL